MDAVTLALAKNYTDKLASIKSHNVTRDYMTESEAQISFADYIYKWFSDKTPTLEELKTANITASLEIDGALSQNDVPVKMESTLPSSGGLIATIWKLSIDAFWAEIYITVVYEAGQHTVTYEGYDVPVEAPKTGIYVMAPVESLSGMGYELKTLVLDIAWESVKTIDPKFLPEGIGGGGMKEINAADHGFSIFAAEDPSAVVFPESFVAEIAKLATTGESFALVEDSDDMKARFTFACSMWASNFCSWSCIFVMDVPSAVVFTYANGACQTSFIPLATTAT